MPDDTSDDDIPGGHDAGQKTEGKASGEPDTSIGYGHPPVANRFMPGQSGNPNGRPKGARNRSPSQADLRAWHTIWDAARRLITVRKGERVRKIPTLDVVMQRIAQQAAAGDPRAGRLLLWALDLAHRRLAEIEKKRKASLPTTFTIKIGNVKPPGDGEEPE